MRCTVGPSVVYMLTTAKIHVCITVYEDGDKTTWSTNHAFVTT